MTLRQDRFETPSTAARRLQNAAPLVSIGVPVYNGERLLGRTLESLLAQTYTHLEIIISDNASTDSTPAIAREFADRDPRVRYVRNETNIGAIPTFSRPSRSPRDVLHVDRSRRCAAAAGDRSVRACAGKFSGRVDGAWAD